MKAQEGEQARVNFTGLRRSVSWQPLPDLWPAAVPDWRVMPSGGGPAGQERHQRADLLLPPLRAWGDEPVGAAAFFGAFEHGQLLGLDRLVAQQQWEHRLAEAGDGAGERLAGIARLDFGLCAR